MRLTQKKIEEIIISIIGADGLPLAGQLYDKENVSEFDLANRTKKDIKVVRKMLYLLYNNNLVGFTRKKDKIKGWYIYYWTLLPENIKFIYIRRRKELLLKLKHRLEVEHKELFFVCPGNCVRLNFDNAIDFEFHCPECGKLLSQDSNESKITDLLKQIVEVEEELKKIEEEKDEAPKKKVMTKKKEKKIKKVKMKMVKKKIIQKKNVKRKIKKK